MCLSAQSRSVICLTRLNVFDRAQTRKCWLDEAEVWILCIAYSGPMTQKHAQLYQPELSRAVPRAHHAAQSLRACSYVDKGATRNRTLAFGSQVCSSQDSSSMKYVDRAAELRRDDEACSVNERHLHHNSSDSILSSPTCLRHTPALTSLAQCQRQNTS